jgi:fructosamine-3-kinase
MRDTARELALNQIAGHLGISPAELNLSPLRGGYLNETLLFNHRKNSYVIWLTRADSPEKVSRQLVAITLSSANGLPVPKIGLFGLEPKTGYFLLMNLLPGENLEAALEEMPEPKRQKMFYQMGVLLAKIHSAGSSNGAGYLEQEAGFGSWQAFLRDKAEEWIACVEKIAPMLWGEGSETVWEQLRKTTCQEIAALPDGPKHFLHGDYYPGNLLYQGDTITGLLDFEWSLWGDREYDFRVMEVFLFPHYPCADAFYAGYESVLPLPAGWKERVPLYKALYHLELLWMAYTLFDGHDELVREQAGSLQKWLNSKSVTKGDGDTCHCMAK